MSVTQKIVVRYAGAGSPLEVEKGTVKLAPDCEAIEWQFEGLPDGASPDVEVRGDCPFHFALRGASTVLWCGPAVGPAARVFSYRARIVQGANSAALDSEWCSIAVPTLANAQDSQGALILVKVSYDGEQPRVDLENLVLVGEHPRVKWDLSALQATSVQIAFSDPAGAAETGPFTAFSGDQNSWIGSGNNGVYGRYTYAILAEGVTLDPGIDNLPPPVIPPEQQTI